jgi:hypothetical protein
MGREARARGSYEERKAQAIERSRIELEQYRQEERERFEAMTEAEKRRRVEIAKRFSMMQGVAVGLTYSKPY